MVISALALAAGRSSVGLSTVVIAFAVAVVGAIVFSLLLQAWIVSVQIRRFLHWFAGTPDGDEKLGRLFDVYGWRASLAVRLFRIQLPPGFLEGRTTGNQTNPLPSGVESLVVGLIMVVFLLAFGGFVYLIAK
jgi:hypothetical protein